MELTVKKIDLLDGLSKTQSIAERKTTLAVLSNVLLKAENEVLSVSATDLELGFEGVFPAQIKKEGAVTVPAKKVYEIVKELPDERIFIQSRDNNLVHIQAGEAKFNLYGLSVEDFPGLPDREHLTEIEMDAQQLRRMIQCTISSTSAEDAMYNTSGIYLEKNLQENGMVLRMVSTDGHRLSLIDKKVNDSDKLDFESGVVISKKGITEINRLIEDQKTVRVGFSEKVGMVKTNNGLLVIRLLEKKFPDYKRVLPPEPDVMATLPRTPFMEMLRRMSVMSSERHKAIRMDFRPGMLEIYSTNPDLGDCQEGREVDYSGPEISTGFNPRYIIDVLSILESETVQLYFSDVNGGCLIKGEMDEGFLGLVMPMKLN